MCDVIPAALLTLGVALWLRTPVLRILRHRAVLLLLLVALPVAAATDAPIRTELRFEPAEAAAVPGRAAEQHWTGPDKVAHAAAGMGITALAYATVSMWAPKYLQPYAMPISIGAGISAALLKEGADLVLHTGRAELGDIFATCAGVVVQGLVDAVLSAAMGGR